MDASYKKYKDTCFYVNEFGDVWKYGKLNWGVCKDGTPRYKFVNEPAKTFYTGYKCNYLAVTQTINGIRNRIYIHRMVAELFIDNPDNKLEVNHINNIHDDNRVCNLEWSTRKENAQHHMGISGCNYDNYTKHRSNHFKYKSCKVIRSDGKIFNSITEASELMNGSTSNICSGIKLNKIRYGYHWNYYDK